MSASFDVMIQGGLVVDGTGSPGFRADIGIKGGYHCCCCNLADATANQIVDARGKTITPGFIDMHSHAESTILKLSSSGRVLYVKESLHQLAGQCGFSPAPAKDYWVSGTWDWNWWSKSKS